MATQEADVAPPIVAHQGAAAAADDGIRLAGIKHDIARRRLGQLALPEQFAEHHALLSLQWVQLVDAAHGPGDQDVQAWALVCRLPACRGKALQRELLCQPYLGGPFYIPGQREVAEHASALVSVAKRRRLV